MRILCLCLLLLTTGLPAVAQDTTGPTGPIATENSPAADAAVAIRIREILGALGGYDDVTVQVADGIVTLRGTTTSIAEASDLNQLTGRVAGVVAVKNQVTETADIGRRLDPAMARFRARLAQIVAFLPIAGIALGVFAVIAFLGSLVARWRWPWDRLAPNAFIADLYRQIVQLLFMIGGLVIALDIVNATALLGTILGAAGIVGLAIGFAVRDTVENYIASVMLSIRQPFRPNDTVEINGDQGKVIRLTSRATILLSFDGNHIRIPNAVVFKSRIINFSQNAERRFQFTLAVDPSADIAATRSLAVETVQALPFILTTPPAQSWIADITDRGVEIVTTGWIDQNLTGIDLARGEALRQVKLAIERTGVRIHNTTQTVRIDSPEPPKAVPDKSVAPHPAPTESDQVGATAADNENALEKMIRDERHQAEAEDLLDKNVAKE